MNSILLHFTSTNTANNTIIFHPNRNEKKATVYTHTDTYTHKQITRLHTHTHTHEHGEDKTSDRTENTGSGKEWKRRRAGVINTNKVHAAYSIIWMIIATVVTFTFISKQRLMSSKKYHFVLKINAAKWSSNSTQIVLFSCEVMWFSLLFFFSISFHSKLSKKKYSSIRMIRIYLFVCFLFMSVHSEINILSFHRKCFRYDSILFFHNKWTFLHSLYRISFQFKNYIVAIVVRCWFFSFIPSSGLFITLRKLMCTNNIVVVQSHSLTRAHTYTNKFEHRNK